MLTTPRWSGAPVPLAICSTVRKSRLYALTLYRLFRLTCRCSWWSVKRRLFRKSILHSLHFLPTDQERCYKPQYHDDWTCEIHVSTSKIVHLNLHEKKYIWWYYSHVFCVFSDSKISKCPFYTPISMFLAIKFTEDDKSSTLITTNIHRTDSTLSFVNDVISVLIFLSSCTAISNTMIQYKPTKFTFYNLIF
jgi:hypothetical protein